MKASGKIPQTVHTLADLLKKLVTLYVENVKLTAAEKLTVLMSAGVLLIISIVLGIFALAFISGACIELLAMVLPAWASYAILAGFFILLIVFAVVLRKHLIVNPLPDSSAGLCLRTTKNNVASTTHNERYHTEQKPPAPIGRRCECDSSGDIVA